MTPDTTLNDAMDDIRAVMDDAGVDHAVLMGGAEGGPTCMLSAATFPERVSALAGPGEVLVSSTVKDLVVGAGFLFRERGRYELKGVPGEWQVFAVIEQTRT